MSKSEKKTSVKIEKNAGQKIVLSILILGAILIFGFYVVLLWGVVSGNVDNPLFSLLGIGGEALRSTLLLITNTLFGIISLGALITAMIQGFRFSTQTEDLALKKQKGISAVIWTAIFIILCAAWIGLYILISSAGFTPKAQTPVLAESMILTQPSDVIGITAPQTVKFDIETKLFTKISPKAIRQIQWDFNDDGTFDASGPKVTHRFFNKGNNNGRFNVTAHVTYFDNSSQKEISTEFTRSVVIANEAVSAVITANPEQGYGPLLVDLSADESQDPDGMIVFYEWDLDGNGDFEIQGEDTISVQKEFLQVGEHTVFLRVTGSNNDSDTVKKTITVTMPDQNLRAEINAQKAFEGIAPYEITLDGSNSFIHQGQITKYTWKIQGEPRQIQGEKITRIFRNPGTYNITLQVEDELGQRHETTKQITITLPTQKAQIKIKTDPIPFKDELLQGPVPFTVNFDARSSQIQKAVAWEWDFNGDGKTDDYGATTKYTFSEPGIYDIRLSVKDSTGQVFQRNIPVQANRSGVRAFINADKFSGEVPLLIEFDGSASASDNGEIINYYWQFPGKPPINYGAKIFYEFNQVGTFPVNLEILTSSGERASVQKLVSVREKGLRADFDMSQSKGTAPLTVKFDPLKSTGMTAHYHWDFGDGTTSSEIFPSHTFYNKGTYNILLKTTDHKGIVSIKKDTITVQ